MQQAKLQAVVGTHGDQFEVRVGDEVIAAVSWAHLEEAVTQQLSAQASSSIELEDGRTLAIYERRDPSHCASSGDRLRFEVGSAPLQLTALAARSLALALLAYANQGNRRRGQWLARTESRQG